MKQLELTVVRLAWTFSLAPTFLAAQVIWAIGVSMVALAALVHLPHRAIAAVALAMIAGHNALDGIAAANSGAAAWVWHLLHEPALLELGDRVSLFVLYLLIPWIGVMAAGYCGGPRHRRVGQRTPVLLRAPPVPDSCAGAEVRAAHDRAERLAARRVPPENPAGYGLGLAGIYLVTLLIVVMLYGPCRWFAAAKRSGKRWWWSYL